MKNENSQNDHFSSSIISFERVMGARNCSFERTDEPQDDPSDQRCVMFRYEIDGLMINLTFLGQPGSSDRVWINFRCDLFEFIGMNILSLYRRMLELNSRHLRAMALGVTGRLVCITAEDWMQEWEDEDIRDAIQIWENSSSNCRHRLLEEFATQAKMHL